jgi:hypothetical protein
VKCKCGVRPCFGFPNDTTVICCKKDGMINIKDKRCKCGKTYSLYGYNTDKIPKYCIKCKENGMINIRSKKDVSKLYS